MAILKLKEIKGMSNQEKEKKIQELNLELIKSKAKTPQGGSNKIREIKKTIARLKTIN